MKLDVICEVAMTPTANHLTIELRDLLYNQCIDTKCSFLAQSLVSLSLTLNEKTRRFIEKTVKIISRSSILIRQHYALIYNFGVRFVEIYFFPIFLKTGWENLK